MSRSLKAHLLLAFITLIWGATFVVIKFALDDISPLLFNAIRMTLASVCLLLIYRRQVAEIGRADLIAGIRVGVFLFLGYEFQTSGLRLTTPSKSGFLTGVSVVLVPVFMALFWRRRLNRWTSFGVLLALVGLTLLTVPASGQAWADWASVNLGDVLTLGCAVAFAFHIIFLGLATQRHRFEKIAFLQTATAATLMFLTVPVIERAHVAWTSQLIAAIVVTGLLGTAFAFSIQAWAQQFTPPTHTALIFALEPVFAWLTSFIVFHERLGMRAATGALLILAGILVSELKGSAAASDAAAA